MILAFASPGVYNTRIQLVTSRDDQSMQKIYCSIFAELADVIYQMPGITNCCSVHAATTGVELFC